MVALQTYLLKLLIMADITWMSFYVVQKHKQNTFNLTDSFY